LAIAVSIASSFRDKTTRATDCIIGEVGLTGEVGRVSRIEQRVQEAAKLGFERVILPANNLSGLSAPKGIELIGVSSVGEALKAALG
ncbi:magnesium chelatase domain-containing protein, partial [Mesorhizobium sp. M7A.F.Ca.MR.362.00.0.0]|uniref:magnesium chelatase domain-containing protein n=1 Tax=Mesorhizobium sp. M7A.F.Ca.MR.362.00.0.0 TaxID=2496779 RepID=UPI000FD44F66